MTDKHTGSCFCGAVEIEVSGAPEAMGYCHCGSCRSWSAGPVNAFSLWKPDSVRVTSGAEHVATYTKAAELCGLKPDQILFVANHAFDCIGAKAAGMRCIVTISSYTGEEDFSLADRVVPDLDGGNVDIPACRVVIEGSAAA